MDSIKEIMQKTIEKCDICVDGDVISKELLMKTLLEFVSSTIEKEPHNVGFVLHTGSVCFSALMIAYAAISNILYNESSVEDVLSSLEEGDMVLFYTGKDSKKAERYTFSKIADSVEGIEGGPYAVLQQITEKTNSTLYLPKDSWGGIVPYYGGSTRLDGRGIRRESGARDAFIKEVLNLDNRSIVRNIDTSTVVMISKEDANNLIPSLSFKFGKKTLKLTELVPVSYYTEGKNVYQYGGNVAKSEPVLKLASKASVARRLLLQKEINKNIGLIVLDDEVLKKSETELPELINRKSLQYVYICANIDSELAYKFVRGSEDPNIFACTREFLLSNTLPIVETNSTTNMLSKQVDAIIDNEVSTVVLKGNCCWEKYRNLKRSLFAIKSSDYNSEKKEIFIIQAASLVNLFSTAVFSIEELDEAIRNNEIDRVMLTEDRIQAIKDCAATFPSVLKNHSDIVIEQIEEMYESNKTSCEKWEALKNVLGEYRGKRVAIVTPKAYYAIMLQRKITDKRVITVTANRFNNQSLFDVIIVLGNISGTRFDPFRCKASSNIVILLYEIEKHQFKSRAKKAREVERLYNHMSTIEMVEEEGIDKYEIEESAINEMNQIDEEMTVFIEETFTNAAKSYFSHYNNKNIMSDVVSIAKFDSGEVAFFSKNYMAYVLDEERQIVSEVSASELSEGDTIVFTRSNAKTRDVVDELLGKTIEEKRVSDIIIEEYRKSKHWKSSLIQYMKNKNVSAKEIADIMIKNGVSVQEATIRGWLDEDSHTVGPRKVDSIQQVALVTGDEYMFDHANEYFEACAAIRKTRKSIMNSIAKAMLGKITGNIKDEKDSILASVSDNIDKLATILQIEKITHVQESVPVNMINRPIDIED